MDLEAVETYSVFTLYNPFRLVVDFKRTAGSASGPAAQPAAPLSGPLPGRAAAVDATRTEPLNPEPKSPPALLLAPNAAEPAPPA